MDRTCDFARPDCAVDGSPLHFKSAERDELRCSRPHATLFVRTRYDPAFRAERVNRKINMDPVFSKWVDDAANIAASGRWAAINERIRHLCANPSADNAWLVQVLASLCAQVFSEYLALKRAYEEKRTEASLLAWRARNLLELSVWCLYCSKSRENARRFYADAGRDVLGLFNAFTKWGTSMTQDPDWIERFTGAHQAISQRAAAEGIDSLDGRYKEVSDAAKECGIGEHFALSNKMLSKFAHPTAMQILGTPDDAKAILQKDIFFGHGCLFFVGAFTTLEGQLTDSGQWFLSCR
jgi:hypothetical protein